MATTLFKDEPRQPVAVDSAAGSDGTSKALGSACQPYDAPVSAPQGLIPIGKLVEENAVGTVIYDAHGTTRIVAVKAGGYRPILRLHTRAGYTLDVTEDLKVWKKSCGGKGAGKFVDAGTLREGDCLLWHRTPLAGKSLEGSKEESEAALAGWLLSEGCVGQCSFGEDRAVTIEPLVVNAEEEVWVRTALRQVCPEVYSEGDPTSSRNRAMAFKRIRLQGESLRPFVEKWGLLARQTTMRVPQPLFSAPYAVAAAYLRSVFQAEGYITPAENASLGLDLTSEQLVRGIQRLLLRFGIFARVRCKADANRDYRGCWTLKISTRGDRHRFVQEIGFISSDKQEKSRVGLDRANLKEGSPKTLEIEHIEPLGERDTYAIQTESGEYLSNNLRVHNGNIATVDDSNNY